MGESIRQTSRFLFNGAVLAAAVFAGIVGYLLQSGPMVRPAVAGDQLRDLGRALVRSYGAPLQLLGALAVLGVTLAPLAAAAAVRINLE